MTLQDGCGASDKYNIYIETHLQRLKSKCKSLLSCIEQLLADQSTVAVIKGEDIDLNKTCGLVSKTGSVGYRIQTDKCTLEARNEIHDDIDHHLKDAFTEGEVRLGKQFKNCLENSYGDKERLPMVDKVCGIAERQKEMCNNYRLHRRVEQFFNEQIDQLKCSCKSIQATHEQGAPIAAIGGVIGGGILFLALIVLLCFCFYKRHKSKNKKKAPNVIYLPAPNADHHVYQEVFDDRPYQTSAFSMTSSSNPPTLPTRYTPQPKAKDEEPAYLEPVEMGSQRCSYRPALPKRGQPTSNPNYDQPPEYSEQEKKPEDGVYFQPLPTPPESPKSREDGAYDKLMRPQETRIPPEGYETVEEARSSVPLEEAPRPVIPLDDVPLGPVPATRTKKSDRQTESHYFLLEEKRQSEV